MMAFFFIALAVVVYLLVVVIRSRISLYKVRDAVRRNKPYFRNVDNPVQHIAILGDSTMYGAGVKDPANTIGGLLAAKYPKASIETRAVSGAKIKDLNKQFEQLSHQHYKLIVVGIGGNDIVFMSNYKRARGELVSFLDKVSPVADKIVLSHSVNMGNIGFFAPPLSYLFDYRTRKLSNMYAKVTKKYSNIRYVNFYRPKRQDHYNKDNRKIFIAEDGFHPSDYANRYFFDLIWQEINK